MLRFYFSFILFFRFLIAQTELKHELDFLKYEAECLEAGWGEGASVLSNAVVIFRFQKAKEEDRKKKEAEEKQKEKEAKIKIKQEEHQQRVELAQKEKQQRLADKTAETLIKEDDKLKKRAKSGRQKEQ